MTPAPIPEPVMITLKEFVRRAAQEPEIAKSKILIGQVAAAMGAISNLYMGRALDLNRPSFRVETNHGFASDEIPLSVLLREIHNSTGASVRASKRVLTALESALRSLFQEEESRIIELKCLGTLRPKSLEKSTYFLEFKDPAIK